MLTQGRINFHKSGNSYSPISNQLAIPRSMVQSIIKKFQQFSMTEFVWTWKEKPNCHQELHKNSCEININPRVILKNIPKSLDTMGISPSTCTILCLNRDGMYGNWPQWTLLHKPWTLLVSLILPKCSWPKKITFENKYYRVMKQKKKLSFDIMMDQRFGTKKVRLSSQTQCQH